MVMQDQARRLSQPLRWGTRERTLVAVVLGTLVLGLAALGVYAATSGAPARADCIEVTFASTLGAARLHACGTRARHVCASPSSYSREIEADLRSACRRAGFPSVRG